MREKNNYLLEQQIAFSKNIEMCREVLYDFRYADITAYTGLAESTMISYDTRCVSPYITVAKRIADMYCTSIERLCADEIYFDIEEVLSLQVAFIKRLGGIPVRLYKEKLLTEIEKYYSLTRYEIYKKIESVFRDMISALHRFGKYFTIEKDEQIISNFTRNFHNLHTYVKVNYRKIGKATDISIGNLTRLEQGNEPMLSAVIKLADFFGVSITQMISDNPQFDYEKIQKEIAIKNTIANVRPPISESKIREQNKQRADILDKPQMEKLISKWLKKVDI